MKDNSRNNSQRSWNDYQSNSDKKSFTKKQKHSQNTSQLSMKALEPSSIIRIYLQPRVGLSLSDVELKKKLLDLFTTFGSIKAILIFSRPNEEVKKAFVEFDETEASHLAVELLNQTDFDSFGYLKLFYSDKKSITQFNKNQIFEEYPSTQSHLSPISLESDSIQSWGKIKKHAEKDKRALAERMLPSESGPIFHGIKEHLRYSFQESDSNQQGALEAPPKPKPLK